MSTEKKTGLFAKGYEVCTHNAKVAHKLDPVALATQLQDAGAGEIVINSVDRDGFMQGYDLDLANQFKDVLKVPMTILGGAGSLEHVRTQHDGRVLIVSSGGPIATAIGQVLGTPPDTTIELNLRYRNTAVSELTFTPRRHMLVTYNTLPHLDAAPYRDWVTYA